MSDPTKDLKSSTATSTVNRGTENTGVFPLNKPYEDLSSLTGRKGFACSLDKLDNLSVELSRTEIRKLVYFSSWYNMIGYDGTPCLFKIASIIWNKSAGVYSKDPNAYFTLIGTLVDIREELKRRTEKEYKLSFDTQPRDPLPAWVLNEYPFDAFAQWKDILKSKGKMIISEAITLVDPPDPKPVDAKLLEQTLEKIAFDLENNLLKASIDAEPKGDQPYIQQQLSNLSKVNLTTVLKQTHPDLKSVTPFADDKLMQYTEVIIYHSVHSVLIDKKGDPTTLNGLFDYPILLPGRKGGMSRNIQPPGLYVSVAKFGNFSFRLDGMKAKKILMGSITGFVETENSFSWPHEYQERIQGYLDRGYGYFAAIVAESAFKQNELSFSSVKETLPVLVKASWPYTVKEINTKLEEMLENYQEIAATIGKEIIKELIISEVKKRVTKFIIKKVGVKVIPVVGTLSTLYDFATNDYDYIRTCVGYVILAVKGTMRDDMTIAAKGVSKIMAQQFGDKIVELVIQKGVEHGAKIIKRGKKSKPAAKKPESKPQETDQPDNTDLNKELNKKPDTSAKDRNVKDVTKKPDVKQPVKKVHTKAGDRGNDFDTSTKDQVKAQRKNDKPDDKKKPTVHTRPAVKGTGKDVKDVPAYKALKKGGLQEQEYSEHFLNQPYGDYQKKRTGDLDHDYVATLKDGKKVQIDGLAHSDQKGKLDIVEVKFENPYVTLENVGKNSKQLRYWDKKGDQLTRLARYAEENPDHIGKVKVLCSQQTVTETYMNILHQQVPEKYHKYIEVIEDDKPYAYDEFMRKQREKKRIEKAAAKEKEKTESNEKKDEQHADKKELEKQRGIENKGKDPRLKPDKDPDPDKPGKGPDKPER